MTLTPQPSPRPHPTPWRIRDVGGLPDLVRIIDANAFDVFCGVRRELAERIVDAVNQRADQQACDKCGRSVPRRMIAIELEDGAPIDDPKGFQWCVVCHSQRVVEQLKARTERAEILLTSVRKWMRHNYMCNTVRCSCGLEAFLASLDTPTD